MIAHEHYLVTATPMHLTVDPFWETIEVVAFGKVFDSPPSERFHTVVEDKVAYVLDDALAEIIGFVVADYDDLDIASGDVPELWAGPRFDVPVLGLRDAVVGEVMLSIRGRFGPEEPTAGALHFHTAMALETPAEALPEWQLALEAGDMRAHYALGYTLCSLGRHRHAYDHLRFYTEMSPGNAWAWCFLGQACAGFGDLAEARAAYERAIELADDGTDAPERLAELPG